MMAVRNLDLECAKAASNIDGQLQGSTRQEIDKLCVDASAVLTENGPYAFFLYLWSLPAKKKQAAIVTIREARGLVQTVINGRAPVALPHGARERDTVMKEMWEIGQDLNRLLLAKKLLLQVMVYLRYQAKAREATRPENGRAEEE